jgi:C1A family cysteine protease
MRGVLELAALEAAIVAAGARWRPAVNPVVELLAAPDREARVFGLAITEPEREELLERARQLEEERGLLADAGPPPPAVDWRRDGWVTDARAQGNCNACVAFATCGALEARLRIRAGDASLPVDLSEMHLFACGNPDGCARGWTFEPALARAQTVGIGRESDLPYVAEPQTCVEIPATARVTGSSAATTTDARKQTIASNGPVIGGMRVFEDLSYYRSGIYTHVAGELVGLHAVCVVGYDDGEGTWIVKNSWSRDWGDDGFFRIAYGQCGLGDEFPFFDPDVEPLG